MSATVKRLGMAVGAAVIWPARAFAQEQVQGSSTHDPIAIVIFLGFVGITIAITWWAARRTHTTDEFYAAGGTISGFQNGLAMAGDYMSAAAFLGISALVFTKGFDGLIYSIGFLVGWPLMVFLIAERLRDLGKYTFADVVSLRLSPKPMRCLSAVNSLVVIAFYLIAQMVGAGQLIELLFGLNYVVAMIVVGGLMILYVTFGGMLATTWVQIVKAVLLLIGTFFMATMVLVVFHFDVNALLAKAIAISPQHAAILRPSSAAASPWSTVSLAVALMLGTSGLPHILMRFFTVPDAKQARESVFWAASCVATFSILTFIIGFGAIVLVGGNPTYFDSAHHLVGGSNMPAVHLAQAVGGDAFKGFIAAVAFATILAVVSGLTLSCASTISHDLYVNVFSGGHVSQRRELAISRITTPFVGLVAILLGMLFAKQNVAYMVGLAFAVAASANFPLLLLSIYWEGLTTRGAILGGALGLVSAVGLTILGPGIWVAVLHFNQPLFPLANPALVSVPLAFLGCCLGSLFDPSRGAKADRARFEAQNRDSHAGLAPAKAAFAHATEQALSFERSVR